MLIEYKLDHLGTLKFYLAQRMDNEESKMKDIEDK